jgi:hypothetical protein
MCIIDPFLKSLIQSYPIGAQEYCICVHARMPVLQSVFICTYPKLYDICTHCSLTGPRHYTHMHIHTVMISIVISCTFKYFWTQFYYTVYKCIFCIYFYIHEHVGTSTQYQEWLISQRLANKDERHWRTLQRICQYAVTPCQTLSKEGTYISKDVQHWPVKPGGHSQV